jgi:hypothetical protein
MENEMIGQTTHNIASAAEMRELVNLDLVKEYNVGVTWTSYEGAPFGCHIRWNGEGYASMRGTPWEADIIRSWIHDQIHTDNE